MESGPDRVHVDDSSLVFLTSTANGKKGFGVRSSR